MALKTWIKYGKWLKGVTINDIRNVRIGKNPIIGAGSKLFSHGLSRMVIGDNVRISYNVFISADFGYIEIGDNVLIGPNVVMRASNHKFELGKNINEQGHMPGEIWIGQDVWIGASAIILPDVKIGSGCVIGAGSVVTKSFYENSVIVGNPAKIIRIRE